MLIQRKKWIILISILLFLSVYIHADVKEGDTDWLISPLTNLLKTNQGICCLGWGRESSSAIAEILDSGGRGGYGIDFILFDSVENKIIFEDKIWSDELNLKSDKPEEAAAAIAGSRIGRRFSNTCASFGLDGKSQKIQSFPFVYKGNKVSAAVISSPNREPFSGSEKDDADKGAKKIDLKISAVNEKTGSKILTSQNGVIAKEVQISGFFKNSNEPRILVVYEISKPGFEGNSITLYGCTGCALEKGFK